MIAVRGWGDIPDLQPGDFAVVMGRVSRGEKVQKSIPGQLTDGAQGLIDVGLGELPLREPPFVEERQRLSWKDRTVTHELLELVRTNPHLRAIGVWRSDRLIAGADQATRIYELLKAFGVVLIERPEAGQARCTNPRNEGERLMTTLQAERAREEVIGTREKMVSSNPAKFREGKHVTSSPYGTRRVPKLDDTGMPVIGARGKVELVFEEHPEQLQWVRRFYEWSAAGKTFEWIQDELNRLGVPTPRAAPLWSKDRIRDIVRNPFYKGEMVYGKRERKHYDDTSVVRRTTPDKWLTAPSPLGALVDPELWEQANREVSRRWHVRGGGRGHRANDPRPLDGCVYCGRCDGRMYPREQREGSKGNWVRTGRFSYHCNGSNSIYSACRGEYHSISELKLFEQLAGYAQAAGEQVAGEMVTATVLRVQYDEAAELRLRKALQKIAGKLEREKDLYADGDRTKADYEKRKAALVEERAAVEQEMAALVRPREERVVGPQAQEATEALARLVVGVDGEPALLRDERIGWEVRQQEVAGLISRILVDQPGPIRVEFLDAG